MMLRALPAAPSSLCLAVAVLWFPRMADACSVCFSATEETRAAFIGTTVFLSALPLLLVGGLCWWLWRRVREQEAGPPRRPGPH